jgi:hypothetical protein
MAAFCAAQENPVPAQKEKIRERPPYNRKEEVIYDGKRYRIHNNYLTLGMGFGGSSIRGSSQRCGGLDFNFHIRRTYFQFGALISGPELFSNNHEQVHLGGGYRWEGRATNIAFYLGPCLFRGVKGIPPAPPSLYGGYGGYACAQIVTKFTYDIGLGLDLFSEFSYVQSQFGLRIIAFFSGAYRGVKRNFNPNVRSENPG